MWVKKSDYMDYLDRVEKLEKENHLLINDALIEIQEKEKQKEPKPLFRNYNVDVLDLEKALLRLRENPDFDLFMKYLYGEYETSIKRMSKADKDQHDFLKGWIKSIDAIVNVEKTIEFYIDQRKKLDKERNRKDNE